MSDAFISYARVDVEFVRKINEELVAMKRETWVDWLAIPPTAEWMEEVFAGIEAADNFIFIISPESVGSATCRKEVARAVASNKRLIPIVHRDADSSQIPEELARINFIFCRESDDFRSSLSLLVEALDTDLTWKRSHTRFLLRARDWETHSRDASFLLRGKELEQAEQWAASRALVKERDSTIRGALESGQDQLSVSQVSTVRPSVNEQLGIVAELLSASLKARDEAAKAAVETDIALQKPNCPAHQRQFPHRFLGMLANHWDGLGRCDIEARAPVFIA
jgi:hypothetical protein